MFMDLSNPNIPVMDPNNFVVPPAGDISNIVVNNGIDPNLVNPQFTPIVPESIDLEAMLQAQYEAEMARQAEILLQQQQAALALQAAQIQMAINAGLLGINPIDTSAIMAQQGVAQDLNLFAAQASLTPQVALPNQVFIPGDIPQTGIIKNYTNYNYFYGKWNKGSAQRNISEVWNAAGRTNDRGIATLNNRYLVAVSPKFGNVGDNIDVCLDNGVVIPCTIADAKGSDAKSQWGHTFGNKVDVIEWESMGNQSVINTDGWAGHKVNSVINYSA